MSKRIQQFGCGIAQG